MRLCTIIEVVANFVERGLLTCAELWAGAMAELPGRKPDLLFLTRTTLDAGAVEEQFRRGAPDAWESDRMCAANFCLAPALRN